MYAYQKYNPSGENIAENLNFLQEVSDDTSQEEAQLLLDEQWPGCVVLLEHHPVDNRPMALSSTGFTYVKS